MPSDAYFDAALKNFKLSQWQKTELIALKYNLPIEVRGKSAFSNALEILKNYKDKLTEQEINILECILR